MLSPPFDLIVFDLDGTLADTAPDLASALNHTLVELGCTPVPPEQVRSLVGHGSKALLRRGLATSGEAPEELVERAYPLFLAHYLDHICEGSRPFEGVEAALHSMHQAGIKLAICTNKPEAAALKLVDAFGWSGLFASIIGGDTLSVRKPDPAPLREAVRRAGGARTVYVGDSIIDADTARAAALPFVAVSFGFSDRPVEALGADVIINHYDELAGALAKLHQ